MSDTIHHSDEKMIHHHESWAQDMIKRCESIVQQERLASFTIYRVPESIRQGSSNSYDPKMLSIGPYHYNKAKEQFKVMQEQKWRNLKHILSRHPEISLVDFLEEIKIKEGKIRNCYSEIIDLESQEFVEMMVLDGCFILSVLLSLEDDYAWDRSHHIYETRWALPNLFHDILLLENQVPFFVVNCLFHLMMITKSNDDSSAAAAADDRLVHLALEFFHRRLPTTEEKKKKMIPPLESVHHLLHLFHWHHRLSHDQHYYKNIPIDDYEREPVLKMIPSATEIKRAGILLRKDDGGDMLNVKFSKQRVLKIPTLRLDYQTISLLRNLIALEQSNLNYGTDFTSYAVFMDSLIDTVEDVALLKRHLILEHDLSMDEDVALHINRLCSGISFDIRDGYMSTTFTEMRKVYSMRWSTWKASLMRDYFSKPTDMLNFQIGFLSSYLSVMQTVFAVLSYRRGSN